MDLSKVKEFIQLAKDEGVSELKYSEKDLKIEVNFNTGTVVPAATHIQAPAMSAQVTTPAEKIESGEKFHEITSPFVGTFYASANPDKPAFVKVGDKVNSGQTLCILEAMKIMNEIESDKSGEIVEICVENESLVEFGQVLFKIRA